MAEDGADARDAAEGEAELGMPPFLSAPKLTSLKSLSVVNHWASARSEEDILGEYRDAFAMCCLHPRLMARARITNVLEYLDLAMKAEPLGGAAEFDAMLVRMIRIAYHLGEEVTDQKVKSQNCMVETSPIFTNVRNIYTSIGWRDKYFHAAMRQCERTMEDGTLISLLAAMTKGGHECIGRKRYAFQSMMDLVDPQKHHEEDEVLDEALAVQAEEAIDKATDEGADEGGDGAEGDASVSVADVSVADVSVADVSVADLAGVKRELATDMVKHLATDLAVAHLEEKEEDPSDLPTAGGKHAPEEVDEGDEVSFVKVKAAMHAKPDLGFGVGVGVGVGVAAPSESELSIPIQDVESATAGASKKGEGDDAAVTAENVELQRQARLKRARRHVHEYTEYFLDEYKLKAFKAAFMEPVKVYERCTGGDDCRIGNAEVHACNVYAAVILSTLGMQLPLQPFLDDDSNHGRHPFLEVECKEYHRALKELAKPENLGRDSVGMKECKGFTIERAVGSTFIFNGATPRIISNAAIDPSEANRENRERLGPYLERFTSFFTPEFVLEKLFNVLTQDRPDCMQELYDGMRSAPAYAGLMDAEDEAELPDDYRYWLYDEETWQFDLHRAILFFGFAGLLRGDLRKPQPRIEVRVASLEESAAAETTRLDALEATLRQLLGPERATMLDRPKPMIRPIPPGHTTYSWGDGSVPKGGIPKGHTAYSWGCA